MAEYTIVQVKRDSTLNWYASNPRLALGEPGVDMDLHRFKIGNGIDRWNELPYMDDDLYKLLDEQGQKTADKVQDLLNRIAANKLDAEQKYNAVTSELRNTSRDLRGRMSAVESSQAEYQEQMTERQQEYEDALTGDFDDTKAEVQAGLDEFNETRDRLNNRMDAIVGYATEDTEILDARTDAEYRTYPNLGTNIRNIHRQLLEEKQTSKDNKSEIDTEIASLKVADTQEQQARKQTDESHEERLLELKNSTEKLFVKDTALQEQIDINAEGLLKAELTLGEEMLRTREEFARVDKQKTAEQSARESEDAELSARIDSEHAERISEDKLLLEKLTLQSQELSEADSNIDAELKHERREREEDTEELGRLTDRISEAVIEGALLISAEGDKLRAERADRTRADEDLSRIHQQREDFLQEQANETAGEVIGLNIRLYEEQQARKQTDESHEEKIEELNDGLKNTREALRNEAHQARTHAEKLSETVLNTAVEYVREHEKRVEAEREISDRITHVHEELGERLKHEGHARREEGERLKAEVMPIADALVREGLDRYEADDRLKKRQEHEERLSKSRAERQEEQINDLAGSSMQNAVNLYQARKESREAVQGLRERIGEEAQALAELNSQSIERMKHLTGKDEALQEQADESAEALLNIGCEMNSLEERLKAQTERENQRRTLEIESVQKQAEELAEASLKNTLNISLEGGKRRELEEKIAVRIQEAKDYTESNSNEVKAIIEEAVQRLEIGMNRAAASRYEEQEHQQTQVNDLSGAILQTLINWYRAREKIKARIMVIEEALVDAGMLDESEIISKTDRELDEMLDDIFSGSNPGAAIEPENEEEAEFLEDISNIFNP